MKFDIFTVTAVSMIATGCASSPQSNGYPTDSSSSTYSAQRTTNVVRYAVPANFMNARPGERWLLDADVPLLHRPETPLSREEMRTLLIVLLEPGSEVEVVETKGWLLPWKRVYFINATGRRALHGWVAAEVVKKARKITTQ